MTFENRKYGQHSPGEIERQCGSHVIANGNQVFLLYLPQIS